VQGTIVPAGTELYFSNEGVGYYEGVEVQRDMIPEVATEAKNTNKSYVSYDDWELIGMYAYDDNIQKMFILKTKPEPWIHAALMEKENLLVCILYIWDTRIILEYEGTRNKTNSRTYLDGLKQVIDNKNLLKLPKHNNGMSVDGSRVDIVNALLKANRGKTLADFEQRGHAGTLKATAVDALDPSKPAFFIVRLRVTEAYTKILSIQATDNLALVRSIRDIPNGDYTEDDKLVVFAASVSGLIENDKPRHANGIQEDGDGLVNGDPKKFDEDFDKVVKNAKKPENADFYLRYCVVNRYAEFYATYDKDNNEHHNKWHTIKPKFVR
jgi:hypothetical protein